MSFSGCLKGRHDREKERDGTRDMQKENAEIYRAARGVKGYETEGEHGWRDGIERDRNHRR